MVFDANRERILAFGGGSSPIQTGDQVTEWDGNEWLTQSPRNRPGPRLYHGLAYDLRRRRTVIFGGGSNGGDTWELVHDCFCRGEGHPGGGLPITCVSPPVLGATFRLAFAAPLGTGVVFMGVAPVTTAWLHVLPPITCAPGWLYPRPLVSLSATGSPALTEIQIPPLSTLSGSRLTFQAAASEATSCLRLTDAVEVTIRTP